MIYIISNNKDFPLNPIYRKASLDNLFAYLDTVQMVSLDAETRGFDPHTKSLISLQLGDHDNQFVVDCESVDISILKNVLESKLILGQNLKFDMKFLFKKGIQLNKIYDTFVAEKVLNCGIDYMRAGLDALCERYCGVIMDKSIRIDIPKEGLSARVISYAADDIKYLAKIREKQLVKAKEQDIIAAINLENRFTPCLAYIEYCGFKLDADKWRKKMEGDLKTAQTLEAQLNEWVMAENHQGYIKQQLEFFEPQDCSINWSSPKQVIEFFEDLGLNCTVQDKGKEKKSVEAGVIQKYAESNEIVRMYLEYKKAEKVVTTYGNNFIEQINPTTKRVHTNFKQVLDTGRISSGGKDSDRKINLINFQNIPADPDTRACFVAEEGNTLVVADYTGQEQIILANYSMDENLLRFYDDGLGDMHSYIASKMYPELEGLSLEEIKGKHKDKRQRAKSAGFALSYGGEGTTIATNLGISKGEGDGIFNAYFAAFPGLRAYFDGAKQQGLNDGFITISTITKRKSYLPFYDRYDELSRIMTKSFWTKYRELKKESEEHYETMYVHTDEFREARKLVKDYFYYKGIIERKTLNYPVQGSAAEMLKMACIYLYDYIIENNLFGIAKIANTVHDELVLECPIDRAESLKTVMTGYMVRAGKFYCKRVPLKVSSEISTFWKK